MSRVEYVEIMKHSTNVTDDFRSRIPLLERLQSFKERRAATMALLEYLDREEKAEFKGELKDRPLFNELFRLLFPELKNKISDQYAEIERGYFSEVTRSDAD